MKPIYVIALILSFSASANVDRFIQFLSSPVEGPQVLLNCLQSGDEWGSDGAKYGVTKIPCYSDWYSKDTFFDLTYYNCQARYGKSAQTCVETDPAKVEVRRTDPELMRQMISFTEYKFESFKNKLAGECCGQSQKCLERFSSTELNVKDSSSFYASYVSDSSPTGVNYIEMSTAKIAASMNQENIERVLLVELAHSCQFAKISESSENYRKFTTDRCSVESGKLMFKEGLGPELSQCVDEELTKQIAAIPPSERGKYCFGKWYREAFSDMKFRSEFTSLYHWTYDFMRRSKASNYGSVYKYISCGIKPEFKSQICK